MTKEEKRLKIESLKKEAGSLKQEVEYYNALQLALKLVLNGSYVYSPIFLGRGVNITEERSIRHTLLYSI
jgi:hypothetical protein